MFKTLIPLICVVQAGYLSAATSAEMSFVEKVKREWQVNVNKILSKQETPFWCKNGQYKNEDYKETIETVIPRAIAACVEGKAEFKDAVKDEVIEFEAKPGKGKGEIEYTGANWNAVVLWNYLAAANGYFGGGLELDDNAVDFVAERIKNKYETIDNIKSRINKAASDIKIYANTLKLHDWISEMKQKREENRRKNDKNDSKEKITEKIITDEPKQKARKEAEKKTEQYKHISTKRKQKVEEDADRPSNENGMLIKDVHGLGGSLDDENGSIRSLLTALWSSKEMREQITGMAKRVITIDKNGTLIYPEWSLSASLLEAFQQNDKVKAKDSNRFDNSKKKIENAINNLQRIDKAYSSYKKTKHDEKEFSLLDRLMIHTGEPRYNNYKQYEIELKQTMNDWVTKEPRVKLKVNKLYREINEKMQQQKLYPDIKSLLNTIENYLDIEANFTQSVEGKKYKDQTAMKSIFTTCCTNCGYKNQDNTAKNTERTTKTTGDEQYNSAGMKIKKMIYKTVFMKQEPHNDPMTKEPCSNEQLEISYKVDILPDLWFVDRNGKLGRNIDDETPEQTLHVEDEQGLNEYRLIACIAREDQNNEPNYIPLILTKDAGWCELEDHEKPSKINFKKDKKEKAVLVYERLRRI